MDHKEVARLIKLIVDLYPGAPPWDPVATAKAWPMVLGDIPYDKAEMAVIALAKVSKYLPAAAEIREAAGSHQQTYNGYSGPYDGPPPDDEDDPLHQRVQEQIRDLLAQAKAEREAAADGSEES